MSSGEKERPSLSNREGNGGELFDADVTRFSQGQHQHRVTFVNGPDEEGVRGKRATSSQKHWDHLHLKSPEKS